MLALEREGQLPEQYLILELSAELKARQLDCLQQHALHLMKRVTWLARLPESFRGVIIGNEVLDALPLHVVMRRDGNFYERGVGLSETGFAWRDVTLNNAALQNIAEQLDLPDGYITEINLAAPALIASLAVVDEQHEAAV